MQQPSLTNSRTEPIAEYRLGDVTTRPGERRSGLVPVALDSNGEMVGFPLIVVHGTRPGPVLAVNGGVHGDEFDGMEAVRRVALDIDPADLRGVLVALPCLNTPAFDAAARANPIDHLNLNRIFPGNATGSITNRMAATFVADVIPHIDVQVDLHTGGAYGEIVPLCVVQQGFEDLALELGMAAGHEVLWKGGAWGGTARSSTLAAGKPAITVEGGGGVFAEANVDRHEATIRNIMRYLRMIDGEPVFRDSYLAVTGTFAHAEAGGFYRAHSSPGDRVVAGTLLAEIVDHYGAVRQRIEAPEDGVVMWVRRRIATRPGDEVIIFGPIQETLTR